MDEVATDFEVLDRFDRIELLVDLGKTLEPMPDALKSDTNLVPGCASKVWVYPVPTSNSDRLRFYADSNTGITKGIIALILMTVQGKSARDVLATDIEKQLEPLSLQKHFSSVRTSGLKNMILKIRHTAERLAA